MNHQSNLQFFLCVLLTLFSGICNSNQNGYKNVWIVKVIGDFEPVKSTRELPNSIYETLSNEYKDCPGFADPSDEYNTSCGSGYGGLPCKKMLYAGHFGDIWFMEYLQGGVGVSQNFYAFKLKDGQVMSVFVRQPLSGKQKTITVKELEQNLSDTISDCSKNNYGQYIMKTHFGLCE